MGFEGVAEGFTIQKDVANYEMINESKNYTFEKRLLKTITKFYSIPYEVYHQIKIEKREEINKRMKELMRQNPIYKNGKKQFEEPKKEEQARLILPNERNLQYLAASIFCLCWL